MKRALTQAGVDRKAIHRSNRLAPCIFRVPELIAYISGIVPLEPGDVISTGTPSGVGLGRTPQRWLRDGEDMVIDIQLLGTLHNRTRVTI